LRPLEKAIHATLEYRGKKVSNPSFFLPLLQCLKFCPLPRRPFRLRWDRRNQKRTPLSSVLLWQCWFHRVETVEASASRVMVDPHMPAEPDLHKPPKLKTGWPLLSVLPSRLTRSKSALEEIDGLEWSFFTWKCVWAGSSPDLDGAIRHVVEDLTPNHHTAWRCLQSPDTPRILRSTRRVTSSRSVATEDATRGKQRVTRLHARKRRR
jgi:hypothetical protein